MTGNSCERPASGHNNPLQQLLKVQGTRITTSRLTELSHQCCYRATGETTSEREALVRHIRGLQGSPWKQEAAAFEAFGDAVLQLAGLYIAAAEAGQPSVRYVDVLFSPQFTQTSLKCLCCSQCRDEMTILKQIGHLPVRLLPEYGPKPDIV